MTYDPAVKIDVNAPGSRVATAFFDTRDTAEKARADLVGAGLSPDSITLTGNEGARGSEAPILPEEGGFWHALKEFFIPDQDRFTYAEGLRRGGILLSIRTDQSNYDRALDILDADGAVDIEERERTWQSQGWTGFPAGVDPVAANMPLVGADASTAGFGPSVAGEDGYQAPQPKPSSRDYETDGDLTSHGSVGAETRADTGRVGTGPGEDGLLNPDMRERIGSGTASMTPPTPTGPQDGAYKTNAASFDRAVGSRAAIEDASLGSPTRSGFETQQNISTMGDVNDEGVASEADFRRDTSIQRSRVRGFILDPKNDGRA